MENVSRRGLFSLMCGLGGAAIASSQQSRAGTTAAMQADSASPASPAPREVLRRTPMDDDAEVFETLGRFEWLDLDGRHGFLREVGSDRRILVHGSTLHASGIKKVTTAAVYRCQVLRRPKGWQAFRILDVIRSAA
ncbi:MAG: hypothetical protein K2Y42_00220 [Hyphomicrobium sp.]|uniref:hypothetical protein n=1 Tax=Hyphomicrobium sp. TaxID=82 RepID=UPI0025C1E7DB|nr:hypothetical protein [Hyphomicrobium sp.]MBX9861148.1 hypothetical protein [Hyphomicrobium sp.]